MSKTIQTHLQSNEVRIPKKSSATTEFDVSSTAAPCQYFKSSFARSLSFSQGGGQGHYGGDNHFTRSLDFEVNYGLSTIPDGGGAGAGGSSQTTPSASPVFDPEREMAVGEKTKLANGISAANGGVVKTLWNYAKGSPSKTASPGGAPSKLASGAAVAASAAMSGSGSSSSTRKSVEANEIEVLRLRKECQNLIEENRRLVNLAANSGYAINGLMNGNSGGHGGHHGGHGGGGSSGSGSSSLTTSLGLGLAGGGGGAGAATVAGMYSTVESVILQTQVETLQWQLKQVDSSRQMYRAVMEEVVRYLDRCYRSLDVIGTTGGTNIGRSKSVLQVSRVPSTSSSSIHHNHDSDSSNASSPRARSSTNLIDVQKSVSSSSSSYTKKQHQLQQQQQQQQQQHQSQPGTTMAAVTNGNHNSMLLDEDSVVVSPSPAGSYSTFRDFTWRRSPKRQPNQLPATLPISGAEVDPEKLAQEAFRLLRTVQNLLNTQEPTLSSQSASSSASSELDSLLLLAGGGGGGSGSATGSTTTLTGTGASAPVVNTRSNVGFSRKLNMRGSRLSLRSSTDDSVHSTSSSNNEDNTDRPSPPPLSHHLNHHLNHHHHPASSSSSSTSSSSGHLVNHRHSANIDRIKEMMIASSAEDESGFSSMNSFQEIGLPLVNSTMLSASTNGSNSSAASSTGSVSFVSDESSDLRDATVVPTSTNVTTIAINPPKLGIPATAAAKAPEIPARVTQSAAYEHHNHFVNHRRWDSAPVVLPQKLKIHQNGAGAGGDSDGGVSSRVLWV